MSIKLGFELESFICDGAGNPVLVPNGLPFDECGWLVEVRSEPHTEVYKAIALFEAEIEKVRAQVRQTEFHLHQVPIYPVSRALKVQAGRQFKKGRIHYRNLYGHETHRHSTKFQTASIHVTFSNEHQTEHVAQNGLIIRRTESRFFDYARAIITLDEAFKAEIKAAKRNPGFYEVKSNGWVEYRSLPNDISIPKLGRVLTDLLPKMYQ